MKKITAMLMSLLIAVLLAATGCAEGSPDEKEDTVTPGDAGLSSAEEIRQTDAADAVEIRIAGEKTEEVFLLGYFWYGVEYASEDSLNKIMMERYAPKDCRAPRAKSDDTILFVFDASEGTPSSVRLTQFANTVRADSGIPYDTLEPALTLQEDGSYSAVIEFRRYRMYYYVLECEWDNGNKLKLAFAVEK